MKKRLFLLAIALFMFIPFINVHAAEEVTNVVFDPVTKKSTWDKYEGASKYEVRIMKKETLGDSYQQVGSATIITNPNETTADFRGKIYYEGEGNYYVEVTAVDYYDTLLARGKSLKHDVTIDSTTVHNVTIQVEGNGSVNADRTSGVVLDLVNLTAVPDENNFFYKWEFVSGIFWSYGLDVDEMNNPLGFRIGEEDVVIKAIFKPNPVTYTILDGDNQTYIFGSNTDVTIKASGDLAKLTEIRIDGATVEPIYYTLESGSTILTLKGSRLNSYPIGSHTVEFVYNDGSVGATLTVAENTNNGNENNNNNTNENNTTNDNSNNSDTTTSGTTTNNSSNPQTGDNVMFYISMLGLSIIGLAGVGIYTKKKRFN